MSYVVGATPLPMGVNLDVSEAKMDCERPLSAVALLKHADPPSSYDPGPGPASNSNGSTPFMDMMAYLEGVE